MSAMREQEMKAAIAHAIEAADRMKVPDGYADKRGYPDEVSDWGAFLAEQVLYELNENGFAIVSRVQQPQGDGR